MHAGPANAEIPSERRRHRRYPIHLDCKYQIQERHVKNIGLGRIVNISAGGILFDADKALPYRGEIILEVMWPVLLENSHPLKLVIRGRIVRADAKRIGLKFGTHEFRTRKS